MSYTVKSHGFQGFLTPCGISPYNSNKINPNHVILVERNINIVKQKAAVSELDELELIVQAQQGDRNTFGELVRRHREGVINVVYRIMGDADKAEDVAQDTFIRAWQKLPYYQPRSPFRNWLYRIATNLTMDMVRSEKETLDVDALPLASANISLESAVEEKERADSVQQAILSLPPASRSVLVLREYEGFSYQEIADTLSIPKGTVMSRLSYARKRLFELLAPSMEAA
ncbi:MAG: sigma-70 family RNA polymerase sigma factor [Chloroflexi bacterium]|nr:sigma-70 family RNA polymerase sigma factor [Chloroflexota bacterium]